MIIHSQESLEDHPLPGERLAIANNKTSGIDVSTISLQHSVSQSQLTTPGDKLPIEKLAKPREEDHLNSATHPFGTGDLLHCHPAGQPVAMISATPPP
jgi:hypothetical protein